MRVRTEINESAAKMVAGAASWEGKDTINRDLGRWVQERLTEYVKVEKSLKGRIDTLQNLITGITALSEKAHDTTTLEDALTSADRLLASAKEEQRRLEKEISPATQAAVEEGMKKRFEPFSISVRVKNIAFRLMKGLNQSDADKADDIIEGSPQHASFLSLKQNLEQFRSSYQHILSERQMVPVHETISALDRAMGLSRQITKMRMLQSFGALSEKIIELAAADMAFDIENGIDLLQEEESLIIPGNYILDEVGHAVIFEIKKMSKDEFHFSIFDSGFGNKGFWQEKVLSTDTQFRVPLITNLSREAVGDPKFLSRLLRLMFRPTDSKMRSVYSDILLYLTEQNSGKLTNRELHDLQTWGTCSYDSVLSFLEYKLPPSIFTPFHFDMLLRAKGELDFMGSYNEEGKYVDPTFLQWVERHACKTVKESRAKFEDYCRLEGDLKLAARIGNMKDEGEFKQFLKELSASSFNLKDKLFPLWQEGEQAAWGVNILFGLPALAAYVHFEKPHVALAIGAPAALYYAIATAKNLLMTSDLTCQNQELQNYNELIERLSPEAVKVMQSRNEGLMESEIPAPAKNRPSILNLDLSAVFHYLKQRFGEIALCGPLLNETMSPLKEAVEQCKLIEAMQTKV